MKTFYTHFKLTLKNFLAFVLAIGLNSCSVEDAEIGPQGPQGEQGPPGQDGTDGQNGQDGTDGEDGEDGNAEVYYSD